MIIEQGCGTIRVQRHVDGVSLDITDDCCLANADVGIINLNCVVSSFAIDGVRAAANCHRIIIFAAIDFVRAAQHKNLIVALSAKDRIRATAHRDQVVAALTINAVIARAAAQLVDTISASNQVISGTSVDDRCAIAKIREAVIVRTTVQNDIGADSRADINVVVPRTGVGGHDTLHSRKVHRLSKRLHSDRFTGTGDRIVL